MDGTTHSHYAALAAKDRRFDGVFFVGVTSTGIYCRPVCPARTPRESNCRFFRSAQEAEAAGFRPCLRCRPELAPGEAPIDAASRIAREVLRRMDDGGVEGGASLERLAGTFGLSSRQVRRIVREELGVPPVQLLQTRRLLLARQLLTETRLPVTDIAFASGFESLRRFNAAFLARYRMSPSRLRMAAAQDPAPREGDTSTLLLGLRPPFDFHRLLAFLRARAIEGVEWVTDDHYARTVRLGTHTGWIRVTATERPEALRLEFSHGLLPALPALLGRVRALLDLDARPDIVDAHLSTDALLAPRVRRAPGLRVPGAFDAFELAWRAILGQQVSVRSGTAAAARFARLGEAFATPFPALSRLTPLPAQVASRETREIAALGIVASRARCVVSFAREIVDGTLPLDDLAHDPERAIAVLRKVPGIGPWTAHYIAMRALRWPDAFPPGDVALCRAAGGIDAARLDSLSQAWRPWRAYAALHLWNPPAEEVDHVPSRRTAARPPRDSRRQRAAGR